MILSTYIVLLGCLIVAGAIQGELMRRDARVRVVFRHIGMVVRQNIPLSTGLFCAALSERGKTRRTLSRLSLLLETGAPLSDAIRLAFRECPPLAESMIRAAEASGTLPDALAELNARLLGGRELSAVRQINRWHYLTLVVFIFCVVMLSYNYFVFSKMLTIVVDFGGSLATEPIEVLQYLPLVTPWPAGRIAQVYAGLVCISIFLILLFYVSWPLRRTLRHVRRLGPFSDAAEAMLWFVWPLRTPERLRCIADSLPTLRLALAAGRSLPDAADLAADVRTNVHWQNRLRNWGEAVRAGGDAVESARRAGLPNLLCRYIAAGARDGDFDAPLYSAEQYFSALNQRWQRVLHEFLWPIGLVFVAIMIGLFCWAIITLMSDVMERVLTTFE